MTFSNLGKLFFLSISVERVLYHGKGCLSNISKNELGQRSSRNKSHQNPDWGLMELLKYFDNSALQISLKYP